MKRKVGLKSRAIKASRPVMSPEEKDAKDALEGRSGGVCEIQVSGVCLGRAKDFSHRIREGQGGPWSAVNGLHACRACHEWTHRNPAASRLKRWALKSFDDLGLPVEVRGVWVLLGEDGSVTPSRNGAEG